MNDEAIFGPDEDYECACKKYSGQRFSNVICDTCGVRVGPRSLRRSRFGHINLSVPFGRDACGTKVDLFALPIVPASVRQSIGGTALDTSYERILDANDGRDAEGVRTAFRFVW